MYFCKKHTYFDGEIVIKHYHYSTWRGILFYHSHSPTYHIIKFLSFIAFFKVLVLFLQFLISFIIITFDFFFNKYLFAVNSSRFLSSLSSHVAFAVSIWSSMISFKLSTSSFMVISRASSLFPLLII